MTLFTRSGTEMVASGTENGKPIALVPRKCSRCGGAGGSDKWAHTGWKCFDCGGNGDHINGPLRVRLYTAEENAKLDAAKAKRDAKKAAKAEAKAAADRAAAEARRAEFLAVHGDLLKRCEPFLGRSEFVADVHRRAIERCEISDKAAAAVEAAIARIAAEDARRAAAGWIGKVGDRIKGLKVKVVRVFEFDNGPGAFPNRFFFITTMHDDAGNTIVVKSSSFAPAKGAELVIDGSVKEHGEFKGEKNTRLWRVKVVDRLGKEEAA